MLEDLKAYWPITLSVIAFIVWLLRLEAMTKSTSADIAKLWKARDDDKRVADILRAENNELLHEMRVDQKTIMQQVSEIRGRMK